MCFKNLPIEFDENGVATLKEGVANPYSYEVVVLMFAQVNYFVRVRIGNPFF